MFDAPVIKINKIGLVLITFLPGFLFTHFMWGDEILTLTDSYYRLLLTFSLSAYVGILLTGLSVFLTFIIVSKKNVREEMVSGINESRFLACLKILILNTLLMLIGVTLLKGSISI